MVIFWSCFPPEDLLTKYDNIGLEGSYLTSLATLQGEGYEGFVINSFTTGLYEFWISQREEILLRKLWHLCGLALCLDENLAYDTPAIGIDDASSQHTGSSQGEHLISSHLLPQCLVV